MLELDISDLESHTRANIRALSGFAERCERRLHHVITKERSGHKYKNRTNHAEQSTEIRGRAVGMSIDVDVVAGASYASHLEKSGHSRFSQLVANAMLEIDADRRRLEALAGS